MVTSDIETGTSDSKVKALVTSDTETGTSDATVKLLETCNAETGISDKTMTVLKIIAKTGPSDGLVEWLKTIQC